MSKPPASGRARKRLLLASASSARRATLTAAGISPLVAVADLDEDALLAAHPGLDASAQVELLATAKASAIAEQLVSWSPAAASRHPTAANRPPTATSRHSTAANQMVGQAVAGAGPAVVVGCDSMLEMDGQIVGKPHTAEVARERLRAMRGRAGDLHTGHCVIDVATGQRAVGTSTATVHIGELSDAEIEAYIATGEPLHVAGSFTIDGYGGPFVERVEGDHHGVVGISLPLLRRLLAELGHAIPEFWDVKGGS